MSRWAAQQPLARPSAFEILGPLRSPSRHKAAPTGIYAADKRTIKSPGSYEPGLFCVTYGNQPLNTSSTLFSG
ncbi:hypothetical protein PPUJ20066_20710 [Pseudomonas putida]|nr:hypothetical protein PPUJ20066_20710 [Pseudomonas putida]